MTKIVVKNTEINVINPDFNYSEFAIIKSYSRLNIYFKVKF